ncbi:DUF4402 domain-containing protein [Aurantiacibacter spongiae]|nr:DUF4402 domain-containing protein [Aurantiacibacter spongiae]
MRKRSFSRVLANAGAFGAVIFAGSALPPVAPARADVPEIRIVPDSQLRFGAFMIFGSGSRSVSPSGDVSDLAVVPIEGSRTGPAHFTISYDRGNESNHVLDIELELVLSPAQAVRVRGVEGRLSGYDTDIPGYLRVQPGQAIRLTLSNCRTRICSRSFNVGGTLHVSRQFGGAEIVVPIPIDAAVISAERQRRN